MALDTHYRRDKSTSWIAPSVDVEIECSLFDPRQPEYVSIITKLTKPVRKLIEQNLLKPAEDRKYAIRAFVQACVKDWRTVIVGSDGTTTYRPEIEGKPNEWLPYSEENAITVFTRYPQFYTDTVELARDLANFQVTDEEVKNSPTV